MGLDFTSIPDRHGAALYILHTSSTLELQNFERLADDIRKANGHSRQVVILDAKTPDGEKVRDFYDIMPEQLPAVFIVRDDDSLAQLWLATQAPTASDIAYQLNQISS